MYGVKGRTDDTDPKNPHPSTEQTMTLQSGFRKNLHNNKLQKNIFMDKKAAIIAIKVMSAIVISILLFIVIGILCAMYLIDELDNFGHLPKKYLNNTLKYTNYQLTQEGFSFVGKTKIQGISEHLAEDIYLYRKKASFGSYHYISLCKQKSELEISSGTQRLSTPFSKLILSFYKNFAPKEVPPVADDKDIEDTKFEKILENEFFLIEKE